MQTKQFKLISIAVLAITLFSGQLFGMDPDEVRIGDFCDENNITKAGNFVALPDGTSFTLPIGITRDFLALSQDLWEHQIIPKILNGGNAVKALARLGRFSKTCREAKKIVHSDYTSRAIALRLANDLIDNNHVWKEIIENLETFRQDKKYRIRKDADGFYLRYANKKINLSEATYKQLEDLLKLFTPIKFFNLQKALTFQADNPKQPLTLNLSGYNISAEDQRAIARVLKENSARALKTIMLHGTRMDNKGAQAIAKALKKNTTLKAINLRWNYIGDEGAQAIAEALKENTTLTTIDLRGNDISDEGAQAFANALKKNTTLTSIKLERNKMFILSL